MIGVTAAASAGVYFARGDIDPFIAAPVAAGRSAGRPPQAHASSESFRVNAFVPCSLSC